MDRKVVDLYEEYKHELLDRREFLRRLSVLTGSTAAAMALLPLLEGTSANAQIVPKDDARLFTERMKYPGATGDVVAYLARPKGNEKLPGVVVVHENRGLVPHIEDVTRRIALEGFLAMAPDGLTPLGGTPEDPSKAPPLMQQLNAQSTIQNFVAAKVLNDQSGIHRKGWSCRLLLGRGNDKPGCSQLLRCGGSGSLLRQATCR